MVNIWGADHQGHVPRMKSAVVALGIDSNRLTILISQMVTLKRGKELVRVSKRAGQFITLGELARMRWVATLAVTSSWHAVQRTHMEFDLELAKQESADNPVYYVQYAHARNAGILNPGP